MTDKIKEKIMAKYRGSQASDKAGYAAQAKRKWTKQRPSVYMPSYAQDSATTTMSDLKRKLFPLKNRDVTYLED